jgi:hypothetical protein
VRAVGLDVHRDFCEVALVEDGEVRSAGRIETKPEALELFAQSLGPHDHVALEVTGNAWEIARILEPHVARVIVVSPSDTGIRQASSRRAGRRSASPVRSPASMSASRRAAVTRSRSSRRRASSPVCSGACSPGARTTRSRSRP